jgi:hypothetical protein
VKSFYFRKGFRKRSVFMEVSFIRECRRRALASHGMSISTEIFPGGGAA